MAITIKLEPATIEALDAIVASGRFRSHDDAIRSGLHLVEEMDAEALAEPLTPEEIAAINEGLADVEAGRTEDAEIVFARLGERYANWSHAAECGSGLRVPPRATLKRSATGSRVMTPPPPPGSSPI